jgi:hypothetical protein
MHGIVKLLLSNKNVKLIVGYKVGEDGTKWGRMGWDNRL